MEQRQTGQVDELKNRLHIFLEKLEAIEPETTDLQEIDQLISLIDDLEQQMNKMKTDQ